MTSQIYIRPMDQASQPRYHLVNLSSKKMWVIVNILETTPARESQLLKTEDLAHSLKFQNIA